MLTVHSKWSKASLGSAEALVLLLPKSSNSLAGSLCSCLILSNTRRQKLSEMSWFQRYCSMKKPCLRTYRILWCSIQMPPNWDKVTSVFIWRTGPFVTPQRKCFHYGVIPPFKRKIRKRFPFCEIRTCVEKRECGVFALTRWAPVSLPGEPGAGKWPCVRGDQLTGGSWFMDSWLHHKGRDGVPGGDNQLFPACSGPQERLSWVAQSQRRWLCSRNWFVAPTQYTSFAESQTSYREKS